MQVLILLFILNIEWLDGKHMVFGKLIKGHEFLNEIEKVETNPGDVPK